MNMIPNTSIFDDMQQVNKAFDWAWRLAGPYKHSLDQEDVRQDYLLKLCVLQNGASKFDPSRSKPFSYLMMVAKGVLLKKPRDHQYKGRNLCDLGFANDISFDQKIIDRAYSMPETTDFIKKLESLEERDLFIIKRHVFEGATFQEIGDALNISKYRACWLHNRAIEKLKVIFEDSI